MRIYNNVYMPISLDLNQSYHTFCHFFLNFSLKSFAISDNCCTFASAFALKLVFCAAVSVCSLNDLHRQRIVVQEASVAYVLFYSMYVITWVNEPFNSDFFRYLDSVL